MGDLRRAFASSLVPALLQQGKPAKGSPSRLAQATENLSSVPPTPFANEAPATTPTAPLRPAAPDCRRAIPLHERAAGGGRVPGGYLYPIVSSSRFVLGQLRDT